MSAPPIRVAFVLPHLRAGGAEKVVVNWLGALDRARFTPMIFLARVEGAFLELLPPDVTLRPLGARRALQLPRPIAAALAAERVAVAYSATNAVNLALLAAPTRGVARIVSEHTGPAAYLAEAKLPWLRRAAMRRLYPRADAVAAPTERIAEELAAVLGRPLRTEVLPNPVIADDAVALPRPASTEAPHLVAAGRLVAAKGFDTLIDAAARLAAAGAAFRLTIHGEGPLRAALAARIASSGLGERVTLAGHADDLARALAAADLFVLSSRREGFGNVVVEAMAAGTPVLATRSGGPESLIRDGHNGFLVRPDDAAALADAITALLANPELGQRVRGAALQTARDYGIAHSTRRLEALLARVAGARSMTA